MLFIRTSSICCFSGRHRLHSRWYKGSTLVQRLTRSKETGMKRLLSAPSPAPSPAPQPPDHGTTPPQSASAYVNGKRAHHGPGHVPLYVPRETDHSGSDRSKRDLRSTPSRGITLRTQPRDGLKPFISPSYPWYTQTKKPYTFTRKWCYLIEPPEQLLRCHSPFLSPLTTSESFSPAAFGRAQGVRDAHEDVE